MFDPEHYPHIDSMGYVWIDPTAFITEERQPCFWCGRLTNRLDVCFEGYFCNSETCNNEIGADLLLHNSKVDSTNDD